MGASSKEQPVTISKRWLFGLLLVCTVEAYAEAQPTALPNQTDGSVVVQFRPPVGKQVHYQVTTSGKAGIQRISLRFERSGDAFLMHAIKELPNGRESGSLEAALAQPVTFTVDTQGKVTGIVDEEAYWRRVHASLQSSKGSAENRAPVSKYVETVRAMSSERRAAAASSDYRAILIGIGTHRSTKATEDKVAPVRTNVAVSGDKVTIVATGGSYREKPARSDFSLGIRLTMVVNRSTGLLLHSVSESEMRFRGKQKRSTITIALVPDNKLG